MRASVQPSTASPRKDAQFLLTFPNSGAFVARSEREVTGQTSLVLGAGALSLFGTLAPHGAAETELDAAAYAGHSSGSWTCGPRGQARYAGIGGQVRYSEQPATARSGRGGTVVVGATVEDERVHVWTDSRSSAQFEPHRHPPTSVHGGLGFRAGNDWRYFGFQLGALGYSAWRGSEASRPTGYVFPRLELRAGTQQSLWATVGVGSPHATTYRRPGAYLSFGLKREVHEVDVTLGVFRAEPSSLEDTNARFDLVWKGMFWSGWGPRVGVSLSQTSGATPVDWQGSLGVAASL